MPVFSLQQLYTDVNARMLTASPAPKTVGTADDFKDALARPALLPAAYSLYKGSRSKGRLVQNSRRQLRDPLKIFIAVVADNLMSQDQGHLAIAGILQPIENAIAGWWPSYMVRPFIFDGDYFVMRAGPRVVYGAEFRSAALDFTT
jgi:hypothetical protein